MKMRVFFFRILHNKDFISFSSLHISRPIVRIRLTQLGLNTPQKNLITFLSNVLKNRQLEPEQTVKN